MPELEGSLGFTPPHGTGASVQAAGRAQAPAGLAGSVAAVSLPLAQGRREAPGSRSAPAAGRASEPPPPRASRCHRSPVLPLLEQPEQEPPRSPAPTGLLPASHSLGNSCHRSPLRQRNNHVGAGAGWVSGGHWGPRRHRLVTEPISQTGAEGEAGGAATAPTPPALSHHPVSRQRPSWEVPRWAPVGTGPVAQPPSTASFQGGDD